MHSSSRNFLYTAHTRRGGGGGGGRGRDSVWQCMYGVYVFCDICQVNHIWINYFIICIICELSSARVENVVCWNAEPLSHYSTWQVEIMLESKQLIWVELKDVHARCYRASLLCTEIYTPRLHRARALSNNMSKDREDGHCYSVAWI